MSEYTNATYRLAGIVKTQEENLCVLMRQTWKVSTAPTRATKFRAFSHTQLRKDILLLVSISPMSTTRGHCTTYPKPVNNEHGERTLTDK